MKVVFPGDMLLDRLGQTVLSVLCVLGYVFGLVNCPRIPNITKVIARRVG